MKIIFKNESGMVSVFHPDQKILDTLLLDEIAKIVVPAGVAYAIVEDSEIPTDRTFRDAWEIDSALLVDGIGADYGEGSTNVVAGYKNGKPIVMTQEEYGAIQE